MKKFVPLAALLLLFSSSKSFAMMVSEECRSEINKLCPMKTKKDHEKMKVCIDNNSSKFSKKCYQEMNDMRVCKDEVSKFCPMSKKDRSKDEMMKMKDCVDKNLSKLSQNCQVVIQKSREEMKAKMAACEPDVKKFCSNVKQDDHMGVKKCLKKHKDELSSECKAVSKHRM